MVSLRAWQEETVWAKVLPPGLLHVSQRTLHQECQWLPWQWWSKIWGEAVFNNSSDERRLASRGEMRRPRLCKRQRVMHAQEL